MTADGPQAESAANDEAMDGDLALDPQDAEQVTGGAQAYCGACGHVHAQKDAQCNPSCRHGATGFNTASGGFY